MATPPAGPTTGELLNQTDTITADSGNAHTFNVVRRQRYTILITPDADFDVAPSYECSGATFSRSGTFDLGFEGEAESTTYSVAGNGTCTVSVAGYEGSTGNYTIVVTSP
jgi:hypothetical protein